MDRKKYADFVYYKSTSPEQIRSVFASLTDEEVHLFHGILGLATELEEVQEAYTNYVWDNEESRVHFVEELADCSFYIVLCSTFVGVRGFSRHFWQKSQMSDDENPMGALEKASLALLDTVKRRITYDKPFDPQFVEEQLMQATVAVGLLAELAGADFFDLRQANVDKLNERYLASFTKQEALARADKDPEKDDVIR